MSDRHMLVAVTLHPDGSQSSRIWAVNAEDVDLLARVLGEPDLQGHIPADVRAAAEPAVAEMRAGSILIGPDRGSP